MKLYLALVFLILSMSLIYASPIEMSNIHLKAQGTSLEITNADYSGNYQQYNLSISNDSIALQEFNFPILFVNNQTIDVDTFQQYTQCIIDKGRVEAEKNQFNSGWNGCISDLNECKLKNNDTVRDMYTQCEIDKAAFQGDSEDCATSLKACQDELKSKGNSWFLYLIGGAVGGFLLRMFLKGEILNQNKDRSHEEFNQGKGY